MKKERNAILGVGLITVLLASCSQQPQSNLTVSGLDPQNFVADVKGKPTSLYTLKNSNGMEVCVTNFGGRIVSIMVPDKNDSLRDVVLGFDSIADYINKPSDFGAAIGRYANRINKGRIVIDGDSVQLPTNNFGHCLHGGPQGWQYQVYEGKQLNDTTLTMTMYSPDGDQNFPGAVTATVTYTLSGDNALDIKYDATTDKKTVINMTNHSYFNLNGDPSKEGFDQVMYINADKFTPADSLYIPTGEIKDVEGTPMDFRTPTEIGKKVDYSFDQIKNATGYDHNWCLNTYKDGKGDDKTVCASLYSPKSGILLEVFTNEPGIQVYTGNFQGTGIACKHGIKYPKHVSVCFESQKYPDSPTKIAQGVKDWTDATLKPGEKYYSHLAYKFSVKK